MTTESEQRKLAAIMFTDMVGYSALAQRDDKLALELLEEHRQLLREVFPRFNGTEIKTIGDAFLIEFNSALEAAQCAIEIQRSLGKRNHDVPVDRRIELKIGIHIGDVVHREGDVYGDGVNIASRIEPLAGAGGICVSMDVERQIRNALEARFEKLAPTELKNISVPMDLFRVVLPWEQRTPSVARFETKSKPSSRKFVPTAIALGLLLMIGIGWWWTTQRSLVGTDRRAVRSADNAENGSGSGRTASLPVANNSIAVLPFANISGKADEDYFSDGMTEELLNVLARVPQLKVVARTSVFQFKDKSGDIREIGRKLGVTNIVEGSVRRDGEEVRITAQLVRVSDGFHIWSETYDRKLEKVFALQDEIAQRIGDALKLSLGVSAPVVARAPIDPEAYDEYLKGRALLRQRHDLPAALAHLKAAVAKAPEFAAGWSSLSLAYEVSFWHTEQMTPAIQAGLLSGEAAAAERAAALEPDAAATEHVLGNIARTQFKYALAEGHYLRAMQIDPSYPDVREDYAELLYQVGRVEDSARASRQLVTLDPYFGIGWVRVCDAATALDRRAEVEEAVRQLRGITPVHFKGKFGLLDYALAYGRADEAKKALADIETHWPKEAAFARQLLSWALGESRIDARNLGGAIAEMPADEASSYFIAQQDLDGYNSYFESGGAIFQAYYFANLYTSKPAGHAMLRDARVKPMLMRYGFPTYWREKAWPVGCRPLGETDFECGTP